MTVLPVFTDSHGREIFAKDCFIIQTHCALLQKRGHRVYRHYLRLRRKRLNFMLEKRICFKKMGNYGKRRKKYK
jgi:hypothetical protein